MDFEAEAKALLNTLIAKCVHPFVWRGHLADALRRAYDAGVADALVKRIDAAAGDAWVAVGQEGS